jgi:hypothetical protein
MMINFLLAQQQENFQKLGELGTGEGFGPWAEKIIGGNQPENILASIMSNVIGAMTIFAGIWFLFQAIIAGYNFMSAAGDKTRLENARQKLTNSLIGIAIVVAAYGLLALIGSFMGIEFLNLGELFGNIIPSKP